MNIPWTILLITAFTDFLITSGTALTTAMVATKEVVLPNLAVLIVAGVGGITAGARTVQQALKASGDMTAIKTGKPAARI